MFGLIRHHIRVHRYVRAACGSIGLLGLLALSPCRPDRLQNDSGPPPPIRLSEHDEQNGISLVLTVERPELYVGEELRFRLAFRNKSNETALVVPPIDGSWDDMELPAYNLEFADSDGKRVLHALGFERNSRCGMTDHYRPEYQRVVGAHSTFELENAHAWAPAFRVSKHARPGAVWVRVHYRSGKLPGVTPVDIVSNAVKLILRGSDEDLWSCSNAVVEKAEVYDYAENEPSRLIARADGYLLVFRRNVTHVEPGDVTSSGTMYVQELDSRGESIGNPLIIAQSEGRRGLLGDIATLEVPGGLLVAFMTARGHEGRDIRIVHVDTSQGTLRPGIMRTVAAEPGGPLHLELARAGDHVGIVWQTDTSGDRLLRFQALALNGEPAGIPKSITSGAKIWSGHLLLVPIANDFVLVWHEWSVGLHLQRIGADGALLGSRGTVPFEGQVIPVALRALGDRMRLVYIDDDGVTGEVELAAVESSPTSKVPISSMRSASILAIAGNHEQLVGLWQQGQKLYFASASAPDGPGVFLSHSSGEKHVIEFATDGSKLLTTWMDYRDDDSLQCRKTHTCVKEAYIAVLNPNGLELIPPTRVTKTAIQKPMPLYEVNFREHCGTNFSFQ